MANRAKPFVSVLPAPDWTRPSSSPFRYPQHSRDRGVEQDFHDWVVASDDVVLVGNPQAADLHYLPIYWTRLHLSNGFASGGLERLQALVDQVMIDPAKTVIVCQYDDGPVVDVHDAIVGLASRKGNAGIDIPLLCDPPRLPPLIPIPKLWTACFSGNLATHPIRQELHSASRDVPGFIVSGRRFPERAYGWLLASSRVALAPRGYGGDSFRFYEALRLGTVPALIGENDVRPFKSSIDWDSCSFWFTSPAEAVRGLRSVPISELERMGSASREVADRLRAPNWCFEFMTEVLAQI